MTYAMFLDHLSRDVCHMWDSELLFFPEHWNMFTDQYFLFVSFDESDCFVSDIFNFMDELVLNYSFPYKSVFTCILVEVFKTTTAVIP